MKRNRRPYGRPTSRIPFLGGRPRLTPPLLVLALALVAAVVVAPPHADPDEGWTLVEGEIQVRDSGLDPWQDLAPGADLEGDWSIRTRAKGAVLASGDRRIELGPDSWLSSKERAVPAVFRGPLLALNKGSAMFDLTGSDVHVVTPFFTASPGGTRFVVEVADRHGVATVAEGHLDLTYLLENTPLRLESGETAVVDVQAATGVELATSERADSSRARTTGRKHLDWMAVPVERRSGEARARVSGDAGELFVPAAASPWYEAEEPGDVGLEGFDVADDDAIGADDPDGGFPADDDGSGFPGGDPVDEMPVEDDGGSGGDPFPDDGAGEDFPDDEPVDEVPGEDDGGSDDEPFPGDDPVGDGPGDDPVDDFPDDEPIDEPDDPIDFPDDDDEPGDDRNDPLPPWWNDNPLGGGGGDDDDDEEDDDEEDEEG
jgi:hypothetical protein